MAKIITSTNNEIIKSLYKLLHDTKSQFIAIENANLITPEFCQTSNLHSLLCTSEWYQKNADKFKHFEQKILIVNEEIIDRVGFVKTAQKVLAIIKYEFNHFTPIKNGKYFILDNITDPGNLGTILRNAVAFNFTNIYIHQNGVFPLNEKVIRSAMGALFSLNINFYKDLSKLANELEALGIIVFATALDEKALPISSFNITKNYAIIMGNEAHGVNPQYLKNNKHHLYIPINGIESLNVASACSIIMYHLSTIGIN